MPPLQYFTQWSIILTFKQQFVRLIPLYQVLGTTPAAVMTLAASGEVA